MDDYGIKTYADLAGTVGGMVLANEICNHELELVSGECAPFDEVFQRVHHQRPPTSSWSTQTSWYSMTRSWGFTSWA